MIEHDIRYAFKHLPLLRWDIHATSDIIVVLYTFLFMAAEEEVSMAIDMRLFFLVMIGIALVCFALNGGVI